MEEKIKNFKDLWLVSRDWEFPIILDYLNSVKFFDYTEVLRTIDEIARKFSFEKDKLESILHLLIVRGLLIETNDKIKNSSLSNEYLISKSDKYFGHYLKWKLGDSLNWRENLGEVLMGKKPIVHGDSIYEDFTDKNPDSLNGVLIGCSLYAADELANLVYSYKLKGNLLDLGCGSGLWSFKVGLKNEEIKIIAFDRNTKSVKDFLKKYDELKKRVTIIEGDFFKDFLPKSESVLIANVLMDWGDNDVREILDKVSKECAPEVLFIHEFILGEDSISSGYNVLANFETFGRVRNKEWWIDILSHHFSDIKFKKMNIGSYAIVCSGRK